MLTIRKEQMKALSAYMLQAFEDRMVRTMTSEYPRQVKMLSGSEPGDGKVRALVRDGVSKAARYGISAEPDVGAFIALMFAVAPNFERLPEMQWAVAILKDPGLSAHGRVELIHQQLSKRRPAGRRPG